MSINSIPPSFRGLPHANPTPHAGAGSGSAVDALKAALSDVEGGGDSLDALESRFEKLLSRIGSSGDVDPADEAAVREHAERILGQIKEAVGGRLEALANRVDEKYAHGIEDYAYLFNKAIDEASQRIADGEAFDLGGLVNEVGAAFEDTIEGLRSYLGDDVPPRRTQGGGNQEPNAEPVPTPEPTEPRENVLPNSQGQIQSDDDEVEAPRTNRLEIARILTSRDTAPPVEPEPEPEPTETTVEPNAQGQIQSDDDGPEEIEPRSVRLEIARILTSRDTAPPSEPETEPTEPSETETTVEPNAQGQVQSDTGDEVDNEPRSIQLDVSRIRTSPASGQRTDIDPEPPASGIGEVDQLAEPTSEPTGNGRPVFDLSRAFTELFERFDSLLGELDLLNRSYAERIDRLS